MTHRGEAARRVLLAWADRLELQVSVRQVEEVVPELVLALRLGEAWRGRGGLSSKPRVTADDARLIAARLEASFRGGVR